MTPLQALAVSLLFLLEYFIGRSFSKGIQIKELERQLTFFKEQYKLLKSEQKQDHLDDNDLDNGGIPDAR